MVEKIFDPNVFAYCLVLFIPSFVLITFEANHLIRRLRNKAPDLYKRVIGNIDDTYLLEGKTVGFRHMLGLDLLVFRGKHIKEVGKWTTFLYVFFTIGYLPTFLYMIIWIIYEFLKG